MTRKRLKKLIMAEGFGAYNAEILIRWYKGRGCMKNEDVLRCVNQDLGLFKMGGYASI